MKNCCNHISDGQLRVLLYDQEDSLETIEISQHVEACETCQIRLAEMVNDTSVEQEASQLLSGHLDLLAGSLENEPSSSNASNDDVDAESHFDQQLLQPPSHPEMLGRIGRYEVERRIGSGGMGVVFKAFDTELNRPVAVKVLAPHLARNGAARQRFSRESRAAAAVVHEHVVAIHNVDSNAEYPYLVMQYVAGESLQSRVDREGPQSVERILRIGIQAALGLSAAHQQGIVHRDIKPANILLEDGVDRLLITDFGLARTVDDASLTHTGVVAGTPSYMSPEQASGDDVDLRTDLFSLGSVLYFVATGHPPFRAERAMGVLNKICHHRHRPVWQVNAQVPDALSFVIDRLLEKRPAKRFSDASSVAHALTRILQQLQGRRPSLTSKLKSWSTRNQRTICVAALMLAASTGLLAWSTLSKLDNSSQSIGALGEKQNLGTSGDPAQNASQSEPSVANEAKFDGGSIPAVAEDVKDRAEFDTTIRSMVKQLNNIGRTYSAVESDAFEDYQRELMILKGNLSEIDPSIRP
jgi:eukaryotic-like serine/threonine-protein kinase